MINKIYNWLKRTFTKGGMKVRNDYNLVEFPMRPDPSTDNAFIGSTPFEIETVTIKSASRRLPEPLPTVVMGTGWPIYTVPDHLPIREQIDDRYWPRDSDGKPACHIPIYDRNGLKDGTLVLWKNTFLDYVWGYGVIRIDNLSNVYVESTTNPNLWGAPVYDDVQSCWVTTGVNNTAGLDINFQG